MPSESLTIVIPALDEEDAIGSTIQRCLDARDHIQRTGGVDHVEIIVVSDGSTDRTVEIASAFDEIKLIVFEHNRGYGAAIKEGWRQGSGTLLGFLDADGTCDPLFFGELCRVTVQQSADVALGSRLGPDSKMPAIRRFGNRMYAILLSLLCGMRVTDTASGMRVVRRSSLEHLYPLPDGLHFTPSMSARAMLNHLRVIERPMAYAERIGESKLNILRDGVRFFGTIFAGVLCYRPEKIFLTAAALCVVMAVLLFITPVEVYLDQHVVEDWMLYRLITCFLLASATLMLVLATGLAYRMAHFSPRRVDVEPFLPSLIAQLTSPRILLIASGVFTLLGGLILWPGIAEYVSHGTVSMHWSRAVVGAFCLLTTCNTLIFAVMTKVVEIWHVERLERESGLSHARDGQQQKVTDAIGGVAPVESGTT